MTDQQTAVRCECTPVVDARYGEEEGQSPSVAIIEAIAAAEGTSPTEMDPIFEAVDLQAVDRLFERTNNDSESGTILTFTVNGWNVFARDDGAIRVCDPDRVTPPAPAFEKSIGD